MKPGDQILEVNGESFRNITHSRALAVLRQTPAKVRIMVYRDETSLKDDDMLDIIEVELLKKPGRGLGLSIVGRRNGPGVYISDVVSKRVTLSFVSKNLMASWMIACLLQVKGGAAEADGRLMQGDQILTVNGNDLRTASQVSYNSAQSFAGMYSICWNSTKLLQISKQLFFSSSWTAYKRRRKKKKSR